LFDLLGLSMTFNSLRRVSIMILHIFIVCSNGTSDFNNLPLMASVCFAL
jgi:hypothetical protein